MKCVILNMKKIRVGKKQQGVTIVVVLIMLLLLSIVGVTAAQISLLSSQSTRFQRDYKVAYEAAQAAITDAIMDIETGTRKAFFAAGEEMAFVHGCGSSGSTKGLCAYDADSTGKPVVYTADFEGGSNTVTFGDFTQRSFSSGAVGLMPSSPPRYIIELLEDELGQAGNALGGPGDKPLPYIYRITAMGFGPNASVSAVLQVDYQKGS